MIMGKGREVIPRFLITALAFISLEIISTSILPLFGIYKYTIPFNILIVLFLSFKLDGPYLAVMITCIQYLYSMFTVEGWEMGTIAGIIVYIIISYLRDLIDFTNLIVTIWITQVFQLLWFGIISGLFYFKLGNFDYIMFRFWRFLPESIFLSLISPFFFKFLDKIWNIKNEISLRKSL